MENNQMDDNQIIDNQNIDNQISDNQNENPESNVSTNVEANPESNNSTIELGAYELKEKFNYYKKCYKKAGACVLWWFLIMNILCTIMMIIGVVAILIPYMVRNGITRMHFDSIGEAMDILKGEKNFYLIPLLYLIGDFASGIIAYLIARSIVYGRRFVKEERRIRKLNGKEILFYILMAFGVWGVGAIIGNLPEFFGISKGSQDIEMIFGGNEMYYVILAIVGGPVFEELIFRKIFIDATSKWGVRLSILISSVFFGLVHGNCGQFFLAFLIGILFGIIYVKTKNVLYTMGLHFIINTWASLTTITSVIGGKVAIVGDLVWNILTLILIIVGVVFTILQWKKKSELLEVDDKNEYDGKLVLKNGMILTLLIIFICLLGFSEFSSLLNMLVSGARENALTWKHIFVFVPIGCFVAFMFKFFSGVNNKFPIKK